MDAYWGLYEEDPSRNVTVSAVIERAGVHRSTFYEYFCDADAVLIAIEDELAGLFEAESAAALSSGETDPAAIVRRVYVAHGDRLALLLGGSGDPRFARRVKDVLRPVAMGKLEITGDPFAPYLFEFVSSGLLATAALWYERGCDLPPEELGAGVQAMLAGAKSWAVASHGARM